MSKVFTLGFPKNGNSSLTEALRILGYTTYQNPIQFRQRIWQGIYRWDDPKKPWTALTNFGEWDFPGLDEAYPGSKFIYNYRDLESWLLSIKYHLSVHIRWKIAPNGPPSMVKQILLYIFHTYGWDEEKLSRIYTLHQQEILDYFCSRIWGPEKGGDLLWLPLREFRWEPLCSFLNKPIPDKPFPHANRTLDKVRS